MRRALENRMGEISCSHHPHLLYHFYPEAPMTSTIFFPRLSNNMTKATFERDLEQKIKMQQNRLGLTKTRKRRPVKSI